MTKKSGTPPIPRPDIFNLNRRSLIGGGVALVAAIQAAGVVAAARRPAFELPLLNGSRFALDEATGQVVVINFWATWCAPCLAEMPVLDRFARSHRDVVMIGASCDERRSISKVKAMAAKLAYPVGMLAMGGINSFGTPREIPQTIVVGGDGQVVAHFGGGGAPFSQAGLAAAIAKANGQGGPRSQSI